METKMEKTWTECLVELGCNLMVIVGIILTTLGVVAYLTP